MKTLIAIALIAKFALPICSQAAEPSRKNTVMDFEAEVIDGQKKAPELFLQMDAEKAELNTILYDRKNFNDFAPVNTQFRPTFSEIKKAGSPNKK
ncbi:MAG: hypothetical protein H7333_01335 [Bdellovibrionales bacterium]|nr:hypothetical protein [Oligoflexia bacterium]